VDDLRKVIRTPIMLSMSGIIVIFALVSSITDYQLILRCSRGMVRTVVVWSSFWAFSFLDGYRGSIAAISLSRPSAGALRCPHSIVVIAIAIGLSSTAILITGGFSGW